MKLFNKKPSVLTAGLLLAAAACGDSSDDPGTVTRDDFNPPGVLETVTGDSKVELRWSAANVEDDFQGYYVFATTTSVEELQKLVKFPSTAVDISKSGIPRCEDNSAFFEAFGLPKSDGSCKGEDDNSKIEVPKKAQDGSLLTADDKKLSGFLACGDTATTPSLKVTKATTTQKCVVSKDKDGNALENGKTYTFLVMGVLDEDLDDLSWSSNAIADTPAKTALDAKKITLAKEQFVKITFSPTGAAVADVSAAATCTSAQKQCTLKEDNAETTDKATLFIGRDAGSDTYEQRIFVSASKTASTDGWSIILQPRGPQTYDPLNAGTQARTPGDSAADSFPSIGGTKYVVYNNQVFDYVATKDGSKYYGKLVFGDTTYAGTTNDSSADLTVHLITQTTAGNRAYFQ
jgi:hypothetical protein